MDVRSSPPRAPGGPGRRHRRRTGRVTATDVAGWFAHTGYLTRQATWKPLWVLARLRGRVRRDAAGDCRM